MKDNPGKPGLIRFTTLDGSESYRNALLDEAYHSKAGALSEAYEKYARPLKVWLVDSPVIFDVCFGLGYNSAAAIDLIREHGNNSLVTIYCFENDLTIIAESLNVNPGFRNYHLIKKFSEYIISGGRESFMCENVKFILMLGDAKKEIRKKGLPLADFVFFDPFSPSKQPEMWFLGFFRDIHIAMKRGGLLATYSFARVVRDNLSATGFKVFEGPVIGRRSPSIIAVKE